MSNKKTALSIGIPEPNQPVFPVASQPEQKNNSQDESPNSKFKRYIIATFINDHKCSMFYTSSLCESAKALLTNEVVLIPLIINAVDGKAMAFNQAITVAWKEKVDGIIFASPDAAWSAQELFDLISSDKDCVALPTMTAKGIDIELGEISRLQRDKQTGEILVKYASLDFMYLSLYSINELCNTHQFIEYQGQDTKLVLQSGDVFNGFYTESQILKARLMELNIETWVNPNHTIPTFQGQLYASNFTEILAEMEKKG